MNPSKTRPNLQVFRVLIPLMSAEKTLFFAWLIALAASSTATLLIPAAIKTMIDEGFKSSAQVNQAFLGFFVVALLLAVATALRFFFISLLGERVVARLREKLYSHLLYLDLSFYQRTLSGELVSRISADSELIRSVIGSSMSVALRSLVTFLGSLVLLVMTQPRLAGIALLGIPLAVLPILFGARRIRSKSKNSQDNVAIANQHAAETLGSIYTVQAFARESYEISRFKQAVLATLATAKSRIFMQSIVTASAITLVFGAIVLVLWLGANDVINGNLTAGQLGQFVLYALLAGSSLGSMSEMWNDLQRATGGMQRITELLSVESNIYRSGNHQTKSDLADENNGDADHTDANHIDKNLTLDFAKLDTENLIELDSVSFAYPTATEQDTKQYVLENINLTIKQGETIAIVGPSGAGKSSLFNLLLRFFDPNVGEIKLLGQSIHTLPVESLRQSLAIVPQKPDLFAATIYQNILYGDLHADETAVINAAKNAEAYDFIQSLPEGFQTQVGERGVKLSGGQQQRIAIARAMLKNAPVLLLDEATSALDAQSEHVVQQALTRLMENKTTIVIAHRLATVLKADRIVVLDKGQIVEQGTHQQLITQNGLYAELAKLQFL